MAVSNVSLSDTFDVWRSRFNQTVAISNLLTEGEAYTSGTITIANPSNLNGGVSLNVSNGVVRVNGNTFSANAITFTSNTPTLTISGSGALGGRIYFDIGALSTSISDANTANIASASSVNAVNQLLTALYGKVNTVYAAGNTGFAQANAAYTQANVVFGFTNTAIYIANLAFDKANVAGGGYWRGNNGDKGLEAAKQDLFRINANTVSSNIGFDNGENAQTTGPISVDANRYLIVNTGARVVII